MNNDWSNGPTGSLLGCFCALILFTMVGIIIWGLGSLAWEIISVNL